ncbi:MAG TPA: hypothetical protein VF723_16285 [Pyrinomonadaceae bacterium]
MNIERATSLERAQAETKQRVIACRQRLRRNRAIKRAAEAAGDGARPLPEEISAAASGQPGPPASPILFDNGEVSVPPPGRAFTPEVDRRARLRAR